MPVTPTATASRTNLPPASDESSVPSGTPTAARSASVISTTPVAADTQPIPSSHGRTLDGPNATRPVTPAPNRTTRPMYRSQWPATAVAVGGSVSLAPPVRGLTASGDTPTPNENAFDVTWPSVAETVRHVTVYTPSGTGSSRTRTSRSEPGASSGGPVGTGAPVSSRTPIVVSERSGGSVNVSEIRSGAFSSSSPFEGSLDSSDACAKAAVAARLSQMPTASIAARARAIRFTVPP